MGTRSIVSDNNKTVVVIGRNSSSNLAAVRAAGEWGYSVIVLHIYDTTVIKAAAQWLLIPRCEAYSRYCRRYLSCILSKDKNVVPEKLLGLVPDEKALLIPTDDLAAFIIDSSRDVLDTKFICPDAAGIPGRITELMSKTLQKSMAAESGISTIPGRTVHFDNGVWDIPDDIGYPCFVKPDRSYNVPKAFISGCADREALMEALKNYRSAGTALIEKFVDIKNEYSVLGLSLAGKVYAPCVFKTESSAEGSVGVAMTGVTEDPEHMASLIRTLTVFTGRLKYTGLFDIDLIESSDGQIYFTEINLRQGASAGVFTAAGINLPGMLADYCCFGKTPDRIGRSVDGMRFHSEYAFLQHYVSGRLTFRELKDLIGKEETGLVYDKSDKGPGEHMTRYLMNTVIRKLVMILKKGR